MILVPQSGACSGVGWYLGEQIFYPRYPFGPFVRRNSSDFFEFYKSVEENSERSYENELVKDWSLRDL